LNIDDAQEAIILALSEGLGQNLDSISWVSARRFVLREGVCRVKS